ncbi:MAG: glycosyltransferase 87 family protein [Candidatus Shapirobacteria bacterium]|nr:glycosyltransferase 87 family protein [Candidatus Shapirobacteria bacterium]
MKLKSFFIKWILIGLFLRLILMPFTVHSDMTALDLGGLVISQKAGILKFYDYLPSLGSSHPWVEMYGSGLFNYPPLAYLTPALFMTVLSPFYNLTLNNVFIINMDKIYQTTDLFRLLFLLKFPYLIFDFLLAFLLFKLFKEKGSPHQSLGPLAFKLWMLNPLTLYATFAMGQFDLIPTLTVVAALFLAKRNKNVLAVCLLGLGGAYKMFPLLFLSLFVLVLGKNFWQRVWLFLTGLGSYLVVIAPLALIKAKQKDILWKLGLALMLLFFSVTHYHPQWFLWIMPFLIWVWIIYGRKFKLHLVILFGCWLLITLFFENSLNFGLLAPVFPNLTKIGSLTDWIKPYYDVFLIKSLIRSLFAATSLFLIFPLLTEGKEK